MKKKPKKKPVPWRRKVSAIQDMVRSAQAYSIVLEGLDDLSLLKLHKSTCDTVYVIVEKLPKKYRKSVEAVLGTSVELRRRFQLTMANVEPYRDWVKKHPPFAKQRS